MYLNIIADDSVDPDTLLEAAEEGGNLDTDTLEEKIETEYATVNSFKLGSDGGIEEVERGSISKTFGYLRDKHGYTPAKDTWSLTSDIPSEEEI